MYSSKISPGARLVLNRAGVALAGADSHHLLEVKNKDLAVAYFAIARGFADRLDHLFGEGIGDRDFDLCFWYELDVVLSAPIDFSVTPLPPKAANLGDGNALNTHLADGLADVFELEWFDNRRDQFHRLMLLRRSARTTA